MNKIAKIDTSPFSVDYAENSMQNTACQLHQAYEICFFLNGHRTYTVNNRVYELMPNSIIVIPPNTQHSTCGTNEVTRSVVYFHESFLAKYFAPAFLERLLEIVGSPLCVVATPQDKIATLIDDLKRYYEQSRSTDFALSLAALLQAIQSAKPLPPTEKENLSRNIVLRAIAYIEKNFAKIDSLNVIANSLRISLSYLEAIFKKSTGISLMQYVIKSKVNHAAKLLLESKKSVIDISIECGFHSSTHFSNTFKKHTGFSPREYRQSR